MSGWSEQSPFARLFSVEEANALLPTLVPLLEALQAQKADLNAESAALDALTPAMRANGLALKAVHHEHRIASLMTDLSQGVQQIVALGIEVKDLDHGLVDFPHRRGGRIVFLCWKLGERVSHWHELDAGFAGRQALD